jgi:bisphosphoglycerate-independent phosphoglycerate mutase (AlkP superfamily)
VHRGNHGYLPENPSERGWILVDDAALEPKQTAVRLVDIAPTLLSLVGVTPPEYMQGRRLFEPRVPA